MKRSYTWWIIVAGLLLTVLAFPHAAFAAVSVTTAELKSGQLRLAGSGAVANASITVDGTRIGQADDKGRFSLQKSPFSSPTCKITVSDGSASAQVTLSGCTANKPAPTATVEPSGPATPILAVPANGAQVIEPLTLSWMPVNDPNISAYNWQVSTSATFAVIVANHFTLAATTQDLLNGGLPNGVYYWRVNAVNESSGVSSPWSAPRSFTISGQSPNTPAAPAFIAPANGALFHPWESFSPAWTAASGAASYQLEVDLANINFNTSDVVRSTTTDTKYIQVFTQLQPVYMRVRGVAADGTLGVPSAPLQVIISYAAPLPPAPVLAGPSNVASPTFPTTLTGSEDPNPQS